MQEWRREEPLDRLALKLDFLPAVPGGNCGMWASVAHDLRFDEEYEYGGSDIEFSWRAGLRSYTLAFAPDAMISARHRQSLVELARQSYLYGRAAPHLYRRFRDHGMPPASVSSARHEWRWLALNVRDVVHSAGHRGWWVRIAAYRVGRLLGSARFGVFYP